MPNRDQRTTEPETNYQTTVARYLRTQRWSGGSNGRGPKRSDIDGQRPEWPNGPEKKMEKEEEEEEEEVQKKQK